MALLTRDDPGGALLRRLLPAVILVPLVLGYVELRIEHAGLVKAATGNGALVLSLIVTFGFVAWLSAADLSRTEAARVAAEESVRQFAVAAENDALRLAAVLEALPVGVVITDAQGGILRTNGMDETIWGPRPTTRTVGDYDEYKAWWADSGRPVQPEDWASARAVQQGETVTGQVLEIQRFDGTRGFILNSAAPVRDASGRIVGSAVAIQDITPLRRAMEELVRSNKELEQFAYIASHDLQEPLRAVEGFVGRLRDRYEDVLDERGKQYVRFAVEGARRMSQLVSSLLEYSRVQNQGLQAAPTPLNEVFDQAVASSAACIVESGATVTRDELPTVMGDAVQMRQLLQNLIGNAVKFRRAGVRPEVRVSARREEREWVLCVRDNGIGIPGDQVERIFLIFQRLHGQEEYPGAGIGLAICKKIVERHGGRIRVESTVNEGSRFLFTIPA